MLSSVVLLTACELDDLSVTIDCEGFSWTASAARSTVDNTGNEPPQQLTYLRVYDGLDNLLYETEYRYSVGQTASEPPPGGGSSYDMPPQANPIRLQFFSPAGFNLAQDTVWYERTGTCEALAIAPTAIPTLSTWALALLSSAMLVFGWRRRREH